MSFYPAVEEDELTADYRTQAMAPTLIQPASMPVGSQTGIQLSSPGASPSRYSFRPFQSSRPSFIPKFPKFQTNGDEASEMDYLTRFEEQYKGGAKIDPQAKSPSWFILDISQQSLFNLSSGISTFKHITTLLLHNNNLKTLPLSMFTELQQLKTLDLSCNQLDEIPPQMGRLVNLQNLILSHNNITALPLA